MLRTTIRRLPLPAVALVVACSSAAAPNDVVPRESNLPALIARLRIAADRPDHCRTVARAVAHASEADLWSSGASQPHPLEPFAERCPDTLVFRAILTRLRSPSIPLELADQLVDVAQTLTIPRPRIRAAVSSFLADRRSQVRYVGVHLADRYDLQELTSSLQALSTDLEWTASSPGCGNDVVPLCKRVADVSGRFPELTVDLVHCQERFSATVRHPNP